MLRLNTMLLFHVNADREVVRMSCGDHFLYYKDAVRFCNDSFRAPTPEDADVVISNAYPNDLSLTFVWKKGITPLLHCAPGTSRIVIASCSEGVGHHGLYPYMNFPRFHRARVMTQHIAMMKPAEFISKITSRLRRRLRANRNRVQKHESVTQRYPLWLYRTGPFPEKLPSRVPHFTVTCSLLEILQAVQEEQGNKKHLKVLVYPCAPLQCLGH